MLNCTFLFCLQTLPTKMYQWKCRYVLPTDKTLGCSDIHHTPSVLHQILTYLVLFPLNDKIYCFKNFELSFVEYTENKTFPILGFPY